MTLLLEFEYDDAHRASLPFIVTYKSGAGARANPKPGLEPHSATLSYDIRSPTSGLSSTIVFDIDTPTYYSGMIEPSDPTMTSSLQGLWQDPSATPLGVYTGGWLGREGRLPAGDFSVDLDQLAVVHQSYAASIGTQLPNNDVYIAIYQDTGYGSSTMETGLRRTRPARRRGALVRASSCGTARAAPSRSFRLPFRGTPSRSRPRRTFPRR